MSTAIIHNPARNASTIKTIASPDNKERVTGIMISRSRIKKFNIISLPLLKLGAIDGAGHSHAAETAGEPCGRLTLAV